MPTPMRFFDLFTRRTDGSGWIDREFDRTARSRECRGRRRLHGCGSLPQCEQRLLRAMPVLPLFFDSYSYLQKPYVGGMTLNPLGVPEFKDRLDQHQLESVMIRRRELLGIGSGALASCAASDAAYFGTPVTPKKRDLSTY